jgi:lipid A ethanolaminephosphotransferase
MWLSPEFASEFGIDVECLQQRSHLPISHDYVFHSMLGMLDIETTAHREELDFFSGCTGKDAQFVL